MDRRSFIATSTAAAVGSRFVRPSANNTVRVAVVGFNGQGGTHIRNYLRMPNVEIAALCDIDASVMAKGLSVIEKANAKKPATFTDVRKLLEDKTIDAVSIATPNHWHSLIGIWACQAGKDVYVEKPCSQSYWEGRKLVEAARKYNRIVQHGTNSRSSVALREAMQLLKDGVIGDVYMGRALCYKWRDTIGKKPDGPVPEGVDYDLWLGPAPKRPFNPNRFHYNWHWNWDYGNGDLGNQGIHEMDVARWGLDVTSPTKVYSTGGHFMFDDDQTTPNTQIATFDFDKNGKKVLLVFEVRHWMTNHEAGINEGKDSNTIGNIFYGSKGYMAIDGYTSYKVFLGRNQQPGPAKVEGGSTWANFIETVRSRKQADLHAEIEEGHLSSGLVHLANISYQVGRAIKFDPKTETIVGDAEASKKMRREYRAPFVVPEKV